MSMESFTEIDPENAPHSHRNRGGHGEKFDQWEREISGQTGRAHSAKGVHFQFPSDLGQGSVCYGCTL